MFREMRRFKQSLSEEKIIEILKTEKRATLSVNGDDGYPYGIPVNFVFDAEKNKIYIHCAKEGHKFDAIKRDSKVCFTTWTKGIQQENDWSYFVDSVVVFGKARILEDEKEIYEPIKKLGMKYYPTEEEVDLEIKKDMFRVRMIEITIEHMTGKHVHER